MILLSKPRQKRTDSRCIGAYVNGLESGSDLMTSKSPLKRHPCPEAAMTDIKGLFRIVKNQCGLKWKDLGRSLRFDETMLEVVDAKHRDAGESCMEMLSTWWYGACRDATPQTLIDALTDSGLKDVADQIEDYLSGRGSSNIHDKESCRTYERQCSGGVFQQVSRSIGDNWKVLARHVNPGVTEAVLRGIDKQFDQNAKESCLHVLENWRQRNGRDATLETLITVLRTAGLAEIADDIDGNTSQLLLSVF
ncbi:uncharacterized protein LOC118404861 [Branchiostoma floridae]|uniref:Uncharacterized protein LOC118404861 n=1 Tax=Branchiostoma floridae TaxID=7739 RepID=A0A9J7KI63_BRAFL|nr:uncharacterized protein LOC118404861 [Branchiostoma floridae]